MSSKQEERKKISKTPHTGHFFTYSLTCKAWKGQKSNKIRVIFLTVGLSVPFHLSVLCPEQCGDPVTLNLQLTGDCTFVCVCVCVSTHIHVCQPSV